MDLDLALRAGDWAWGAGTMDLDLQEQTRCGGSPLATARFLFPRLAGL